MAAAKRLPAVGAPAGKSPAPLAPPTRKEPRHVDSQAHADDPVDGWNRIRPDDGWPDPRFRAGGAGARVHRGHAGRAEAARALRALSDHRRESRRARPTEP